MLDDKDKVWAAARYQHIEYAKKFIAKTFQQFVDENKAGKFAKEKNVSWSPGKIRYLKHT